MEQGLVDPGLRNCSGVVDSEFARVRLSIDHAGNGPRLRIE